MSTALTTIQEQIAAELANVSDTVAAPSGHRITLKGKVFTLPDGAQTKGALEVTILDWRNVNLYYPGAYNSQKPEEPSCFAISKIIDGMKPSDNANDAQSDACKGCPWNEWGSASGGGKGKACKNTVRIAVVPVDATSETPIWTIDVSPTGLTGFNNLVNDLKNQRALLPVQVVTSIDFDSTCDFPKLTFAGGEEHGNLEVMFPLREAAAALLEREPSSN